MMNSSFSCIKKVVLSCSMEKDSKLLELMEKIKNYNFSEEVQFHLIHIYLLPNYPNVHLRCLFASEPKKEMVEYLKREKADMVVTTTKGKHGLSDFFMSSFSDYLMKFSLCDLLVLR